MTKRRSAQQAGKKQDLSTTARLKRVIQEDTPVFRNTLAMVVLGISILGLVGLSFTAIITSDEDDQTAINVFNAVLPLIGTWVGTLLAFYFGKESFESGANATQRTLQVERAVTEILESIPVEREMRPFNQIVYYSFEEGQEATCKLTDILSKFESLERIPFINAKRQIIYMVYKDMIHRFRSHVASDPTLLPQGKTIDDLTLQDLFDWKGYPNVDLKTFFKNSFGFVALDDTLADAKEVMDSSTNDQCDDVFVTRRGKSDEEVLGWITDNAIARKSVV